MYKERETEPEVKITIKLVCLGLVNNVNKQCWIKHSGEIESARTCQHVFRWDKNQAYEFAKESPETNLVLCVLSHGLQR